MRTILKESAEERRRFLRDAGNLVRCLTIELEIELGLGPAVVPVEKGFELAPPQAPLHERGASDGDAHARRWEPEPMAAGGEAGARLPPAPRPPPRRRRLSQPGRVDGRR